VSKVKPVDIDAVLAANTRRKPGGVCIVCRIVATMPADVQAKLEAAFDDRERYSAPSLTNVFTQLGHQVGRSSVERHRNRECVTHRG
jgi:hypothetical protein